MKDVPVLILFNVKEEIYMIARGSSKAAIQLIAHGYFFWNNIDTSLFYID